MTWATHPLLGISTLWLLAPLPSENWHVNIGVLAAVAAFGALLPDLDASESKIKHLRIPHMQIKPFLLPAIIVNRTEQHRGLLHSLVGLGLVAFCALPSVFYAGWSPLPAFVLGYASHLLADSATKSGIELLYPRRTRLYPRRTRLYPRRTRYYLLPKAWRFTTGSFAEETLMVPLAVSVLTLLLNNLFNGF